MPYQLRPDPKLRKQIEDAVQASSNMCWTCGSCDFECPMNRATGSLRPQKIVRLATMGLLDDLLDLPEIWYCLSCRRCLEVCPNRVKPATLIDFARREAAGKDTAALKKYRRYRALFSLFQRVRWHTADYVMRNELPELTHDRWCSWLEEPVPEMTFTLTAEYHVQKDWGAGDREADFQPQACFTCGECSSACPVSGERSVFDPRTIFRMANLGAVERLLKSPSLWLCIACQRCTEACSQLVKGDRIIKHLQNLALASGAVDPDFPFRFEKANRLIYTRLLDEIDMVFNFNKRPDRQSAIIDTINSQGLCAARPVRPA